MTKQEFALHDGESEILEFKQSLGLKDEIGQAVSAFSNTKGGRIIIGVSDSGKAIGVQLGKNTIEHFAHYIKQNTDSPVFPNISVEKVGNKHLIVVSVQEANEKPVFFKDKAYKRIGCSSHRLSASEIRRLAKESGRRIYWDEKICEGATLESIDWDFVQSSFIPWYESVFGKNVVSKPIPFLDSLGALRNGLPTNAGILLFGKMPKQFFRNAYIALARYKGEEVGPDRLDYKEFTSNLFGQIDGCNDYIVEHMAVMSKLEPGKVRRDDIPEYGTFSIRELITNALCHREYENQHTKVIIKMFSERIEFYNPGGLPKGITPKNITDKQFSRNPTIAKVLSRVRYIEELGEGWDKIIQEHKSNPLKLRMPTIKSDNFSTLVTIFSSKDRFKEEKIRVFISERQKKIIRFIEKSGRATTGQCAKLLNVSEDTALRNLSQLKKLGLIERKGVGKGIYYVLS